MSLQATANLLQQQGRNDDKMLVHMTPREVAGLEAIARAKGGSLTINPKTGLPEAGFLDDVLPIAASAALMYFGGPLGASIGQGMGLSGALAQGVGMGLLTGGATALLTGDINKGLKTGLTAGVLSGGMSALSGPAATDIPTANVETTTPALQAAATETAAPNAFTYNSAGEMVPANYPAQVTGATNFPPEMAGPPKSAMVSTPLTGNQKLAMGLGGAGALSLLGGMQNKGVSVPTDKGTIRPYEYKTAMRQPQQGQSQFFQPIQYDIAGRTTSPIDTSERTYFDQGYTALPTYEAANGGEVPPNLDRMPAGGLAAIQGMRDGYSPMTTVGGDIPQFSNGGQPEDKKPDSVLRMMQNAKFERDMPDQMRDYLRAKRMGLLEGGMMGEEQAKLAGGKMPDFMFEPNLSPDLKNAGAMAMLNTDLDDETRLKLMASGSGNKEKMGLDRYGAGVTRKIGRDSDLSAFFEQSPGGKDKSYGARYSKRFAEGGQSSGIARSMAEGLSGAKPPKSSSDPITQGLPYRMGAAFRNRMSPELLEQIDGMTAPATTAYSFNPVTQQYSQTAVPGMQDATDNLGLMRLFAQNNAPRDPRYSYDPGLQAYTALSGGGHLGDYSDGGRLLKGPGDGVSDSIPASINNKQPARLADGEFVIPARIVSELGNGSTDAGAKRLYDMMDRIQAGRKKTVGKSKVAVDSKARKHLPA
jgi:hypothetical protein